MGRKALSDMSAQQFVEMVAALGGRYDHVADSLGKSRATISKYANGHQAIPVDTTERLRVLLTERAAKLLNRASTITATQESIVSQLIVATNEIKTRDPARLPFLMRRGNTLDTRVYPAYRLRHTDFEVYCHALVAWHTEVIARRQRAGHAGDIRSLDLELADLKVLAGNAQGAKGKGAPYDMWITFSEWFVVSRALRWNCTPRMYAIYQHWRHHKGPGFPRVRGKLSSPTGGSIEETQ